MNTKDIIKADALKAVRLASEYAIEYVSSIHDRRVIPSKSDLDALNKFNEALPEVGSDCLTVLEMLHLYASPATVATTGGRYFGLVVGGTTPASMAASILTSAWDQIAIMDSTAPSAIHLERIAGKWLLELLNLPTKSSVGFTTGSSVANLVALAAARNAQYEKQGLNLNEMGLSGVAPLRIVLSSQAHVTIRKALGLLGFGNSQFIEIPCDSEGRIVVDKFPEVGPDTIVCLQAGNVNSGACDPFNEIVQRVKSAGAWVHIDGAFGLWAGASANKKHLVAGVELADSWAVDAHKWLNTPYDCGVIICKEPDRVHQVMSTLAPYLTEGQNVPPKDMIPEFSRRARGVEVWAAIKEMGRSGVSDLIDRCCEYALLLSLGLKNIGYLILNEVVLNQVVVTIGSQEELHQIITQVQDEGVCWFGETHWKGTYAFRLSVSSWATTEEDIERTLASIKKVTDMVLKR